MDSARTLTDINRIKIVVMPELPEVERGRRIAESVLLNQTIVRVQCAPDKIVYKGVAPSTFARKMKGKTINAVGRWGKYLWFECGDFPWPTFHFGMTGSFKTPNVDSIQYRTGPKEYINDSEWPPRFTKVHFWTAEGRELVMTNARRLGRIRLHAQHPRDEAPLNALGFDPFIKMPTAKALYDIMSKRKAPMKALLLDQKFAAGVGNWIADEILYQAGISPLRRACDVTMDESKLIRKHMQTIIKKAVDANAVKGKYPKKWLFHRRWGKQRDAVTVKGETIEHLTVGSRTTAWVPAVQR